MIAQELRFAFNDDDDDPQVIASNSPLDKVSKLSRSPTFNTLVFTRLCVRFRELGREHDG